MSSPAGILEAREHLIDFGEVVLEACDQDYQGDTLLLLRCGYSGPPEYGVLLFGWGSCSGCDALEACESFEEVAALRNELFRQVQWRDTLAEAVELVKKPDDGTSHAPHLYRAMMRLVPVLEAEAEYRDIRLRANLGSR